MRLGLRAPRRAPPLSVLACLLLLGVAPPAHAEVIDRILAVVDGRPLLLSETRALAAVKGLDADAALEALIDAHLMFREAARLAQSAVGEADEARALASLRERRKGAEPVAEAELRRIARRELVILRYVEFRFRPQVRVTDEALLQAYEAEYGERPGSVPPFAEVAEALSRRLAERDLDARIETWLRELRAAAQIRYN